MASHGRFTAAVRPTDRPIELRNVGYEAQERIAEQRLNLIDKYQKCLRNAGGDQSKTIACDTYLKSAEALK